MCGRFVIRFVDVVCSGREFTPRIGFGRSCHDFRTGIVSARTVRGLSLLSPTSSGDGIGEYTYLSYTNDPVTLWPYTSCLQRNVINDAETCGKYVSPHLDDCPDGCGIALGPMVYWCPWWFPFLKIGPTQDKFGRGT